MYGNGGAKENELTLDQFRRLASILKRTNLSIMNLGGGEPLMRKDICDIISIFSKDFDVRVQSNGYLAYEEWIKQMAGAGLRHVSISLDTLDPAKFDYITKTQNSWNKVVENMALFSKHLPRRGGLLIMNSVFSRENLEEMPSLIKFANSNGFYASLIPIQLAPKPASKHFFKDYAPELAITEQDKARVAEVYDQAITMKKRGYKIANSYNFLKRSAEYLQGRYTPWMCDAGTLYFEMNPRADFFLCTDIGPYGNVLHDDVFNKINVNARQKTTLKSISSCSGCMHPCWAESTQLAHDPLVFIEKLFEVARTALVKRKVAKRY